MSKAFKRYKARLETMYSEPLTMTEFRGLKKFFNQCPASVPLDDWQELFDAYNEKAADGEVRITDKHTEKGLAWLGKAIGQIRRVFKKDPFLGGLDVFEAAAKREEFSHFSFYGFCDCTTNFVRTSYPDRRSVLPMWTIHLKDGRQVTYTYASWQDGRFWTGREQYI